MILSLHRKHFTGQAISPAQMQTFEMGLTKASIVLLLLTGPTHYHPGGSSSPSNQQQETIPCWCPRLVGSRLHVVPCTREAELFPQPQSWAPLNLNILKITSHISQSGKSREKGKQVDSFPGALHHLPTSQTQERPWWNQRGKKCVSSPRSEDKQPDLAIT